MVVDDAVSHYLLVVRATSDDESADMGYVASTTTLTDADISARVGKSSTGGAIPGFLPTHEELKQRNGAHAADYGRSDQKS